MCSIIKRINFPVEKRRVNNLKAQARYLCDNNTTRLRNSLTPSFPLSPQPSDPNSFQLPHQPITLKLNHPMAALHFPFPLLTSGLTPNLQPKIHTCTHPFASETPLSLAASKRSRTTYASATTQFPPIMPQIEQLLSFENRHDVNVVRAGTRRRWFSARLNG